ncbi:MAG: 2-oxo-4-hydroxy-4-carboxy-5-ureidoimidazoline decarboxylase [Alphaproteobacteria bacterium]|nr:2-oxo-4-hydroxy-4-carboxy-5-ureidoimidazoline decarboxylase [Alphaproteobacteria bacterium]
MKLTEANALSAPAFEQAFGEIAEHSPWVAARAAGKRPFSSRDAMVEAFAAAVVAEGTPAQLALLRAHPDLATRARLTPDSTREQAGAGLDTLTAAEFARFTELNTAYKEKNGFPFIFAVKGATKHQILAGFESRIHNDAAVEFQTALAQVCRIIRFRLEDRVQP